MTAKLEQSMHAIERHLEEARQAIRDLAQEAREISAEHEKQRRRPSEPQKPSPPELWDTADIAVYLRQNRKSVQNRLIHRPDFPEPIRGAERPKLWLKQAVLDYLLDEGSRSRVVPMRGRAVSAMGR